MTQVNLQSDMQNTSMTRQQMQLQAATMRSNAQQLQHLTNPLGNLGTKVGKVIASHPTCHAIQATLSHPNVILGQSNDPQHLGSLTRPHPVSMSIPTFNYGPYVQAFQPQPNDKNARKKARFTITQVMVKSKQSIDIKEEALLLWINKFLPEYNKDIFLEGELQKLRDRVS